MIIITKIRFENKQAFWQDTKERINFLDRNPASEREKAN